MRKRIEENGITIITLVITVIVLMILASVTLNTLLGDNGIIKEAKQTKENYELAQEKEKDTMNSLYTELVTQLVSIEEDNENEDTESSGTGTATSEQILEGYTAYQGGQLITGNMPNRGAVMKELSAGESYIIPEGYHNGNGVITVKNLVSQTLFVSFYNQFEISGLDYSNYSEITFTTSGMTSTAGSFIIQNGDTTIRNETLINSSVTYDCSTFTDLSFSMLSGATVNLTISVT